MTLEEMKDIFLVETFEKDDYMNPHLPQQYRDMATRREYAAARISDPKYKEMATALAAWERRVADAMELYRGKKS